MISISLSIAPHHPQVNPFPCLFPHIYTLSTQPDVLRRAYHVSATRNFRLAPIRTPPSLRDLSPLPSPSSYALPPNYAPHHAWRGARPSGAREQDRQAMSTPHSLRSSPASFPYSPVSRETREDHPRHPKRERERVRHVPGLRRWRLYADTSPLSNPRRRAGFTTHVFHVKPLSTDQSPPALLRPGACRARAVSGVRISAFVRPRPRRPALK